MVTAHVTIETKMEKVQIEKIGPLNVFYPNCDFQLHDYFRFPNSLLEKM